MGSVTSRMLVAFQGEGAGAGELTWGQRGIWQTMLDTGRTMNIGGKMPLPTGASVEKMAAVLRYIVSRHQSLRTRLLFVPDGPPRQVVSESGELALEIVDVDGDDDADAAAEMLRLRYEATPFDFPVEWPVRMGVVRRDDVPTHLVVQYCHGLGVGPVLLAAYAIGLARRTGRNPSVAQLVVNNRFRPGHADAVTHLAQLSICAIDVADTTFDEVAIRAWKAATKAYIHGYFDTVALKDRLARIAQERGETDISCIVNDRRTQGGGQQRGQPPTEEQLQAALNRTTSWWKRKVESLDATLNVSADSAPSAVELSICADTRRIGPAEIEALAFEMEAVAIEAAFDGAASTRVVRSPG